MKKKLLFLVFTLLSTLTASAYDAYVDGIYYNLVTKAKQAEVTSNGYYCYSGNVTIPETITYDGVTYSVTSIGYQAFWRCYLTEVTIPSSVTSIGDEAFYLCSSLTEVIIPNSVTEIGGLAFYGCSSLTSVSVESGNSVFDSRDNCNAIIETATNTLIFGCKNSIIPNSVTSIGECAFDGCKGLTSVTIPNSVTSIGAQAFRECSSLTSVTIPNSVTSIEQYAFFDCSGLTSVTIGNSVTSIGYIAFGSCPELTDVYCYAENVPWTDSGAFYWSYVEYCTLHVPAASMDAYKVNEPWSGFGTIEALKAEANLGSNGFTTFAYPYALDLTNLPVGVKAYKASSVSGEKVRFTELNQTVPANTGILLEGAASSTVEILVAASGTYVANNQFHVNETGATFDAEPGYTYYGMIKNSDPLTFGTFAPASVAIPSDKAYLMVAGGSSSAHALRAEFGSDVTGLNETKAVFETTVKDGTYLENGRIVIYKAGNKFIAAGAQIK